MTEEIELKFLVIPANLPDLTGLKMMPIRQDYICIGEKEETRIRKKGSRYFITVKGDGTLVRNEWESEISKEVYEALLPAAQGRTVEKDRYEIELPGGKIAELDIYRGKLEGHMTVEVEFESIEEAKAFLDSKISWVGDNVTDDKRLKNKALAVKGWPQDE